MMLESMVQAAPELSTLRSWARDQPEKYFRTLKILAQLAGYADRREVRSDIFIALQGMSDEEIDSISSRMDQGEVIDVTEFTG